MLKKYITNKKIKCWLSAGWKQNLGQQSYSLILNRKIFSIRIV